MRGLAQGAVGGDAIADAVGSSKRTLNRRLAERGTSIRELIAGVRLQVAQKLMRDTDVTIADIAATICYSDVAAFSRAFSARIDLSPAAWRQQATPQGRNALKRKEPNAGRIG
jgi:transcriptional regulator GlxA family with amidase domain